MIRKKISNILKKVDKVSKNKQHQPLFFVHIPKTAGTSFRSALESEFNVFSDYGQKSHETSAEVLQFVYKENNFFPLKKIIEDTQSFCITGHVSLLKFMDFVPASNIVTFVRKPMAQILSHYNHYLSHHDFDDDLDVFLDKGFTKNFQSSLLETLPLGLIGFIGITEEYTESLLMLNKALGLDLKLMSKNVNNSKKHKEEALEGELLEKFEYNNRKDINLYNEALFLHEQRKELSRKGLPWTYGVVHLNNKGLLHGCAYQSNNEEIINVVVKINEKKVGVLQSRSFYSNYPKANFPRDRYISFNFRLPKNITKKDKIDVYVEDTGQKLNFKPIKVAS